MVHECGHQSCYLREKVLSQWREEQSKTVQFQQNDGAIERCRPSLVQHELEVVGDGETAVRERSTGESVECGEGKESTVVMNDVAHTDAPLLDAGPLLSFPEERIR